MKESSASATITRTVSDKLDAVTVSRPCFKKLYITAHPIVAGDPYQMFENLAVFLHENDAAIVSQDVFGSCMLQSNGLRALEKAFGEIKWPVTWIEGEGRLPQSLTGTQAYAISGTFVKPVRLDGRIVGGVFEDDDAAYCLLGDLRPHDMSRADSDQARELFEKMERALSFAQMDFSHVVRTWLYINRILSWYDRFNAARTSFFSQRGVFEGLVPASTGIGAGNCAGAAVVGEALAIKPKKSNVRIQAIPSPLQCPAPNYRSSFSRAVEVVLSDHRRLYVSGTASIDPGGKTAHIGDIEKQIARTMKVVEGILESRQMGWADISRAVAYFKDIEHAPLLDIFCQENRLPPLPVAVAHADICRDDLLFEIEVDAVVV
ncbi:MAG: RidA family protein [Planctomycetota bacterium]|jgi:enamine deaminase RidA (YjgF/YER057c/UK114 family)